MTQTAASNIAQIEYWNTKAKAGETWAKFQEGLDRQIETFILATTALPSASLLSASTVFR
jgi:hypothetical protein